MTALTPALHAPIPVTITLTTPLHHGAGNSGNTALLRSETVIQPDGTQAQVPFVSANSVRHGLRNALAWHLATTLDLPDGSLSKPVVDLLWSGGAVTSTGAQTNLELPRKIEAVLPMLGLLGYAAQSDIISGTLRVDPLILVCRENAWRLPPTAAALPHAGKGAAAYRGEEFGTRHDVSGTPVDRYLDIAADLTGTTQMIYDLQVLKAGAVLSGGFGLTPAATSTHRRVLEAALALWAPGGRVHLAAKNAVGFGQGSITGLPDTSDSLTWWTSHLVENADDVRALLSEIAG
ncbi:hypothetical protein [Nocardia farcinica]|uniref:hypothetical protein n=1 Tax=Nocardia farcinica TaxID=37329 RepID=UPI0024579DC0|nr:hypothetical protein [Nocardia farcinica]